MRIPLKDIFIGPRQRKDYGKQEMDDLQKSLEENGQITAITVRPASTVDAEAEDYEGQPWTLVAGGRRLLAAHLLGWSDIEGFAREEMAELTHQVLELHENLIRKAMDWQEEVKAKQEILRLRQLENPEITAQDVAREIGDSAANFSRDVKTAKLLEKNPGLGRSSSKHSALNAGKILEENFQREALKAASEGTTRVSAAGTVEERIVTADALTYVRKLPEASIDLTLIDGPYGYNYWKGGQKQSAGDSSLSQYDDSPESVGPMYRELFPELVRATRETGWLVMFCGKETYEFLEHLATECCGTHHAYRSDQSPKQCVAAQEKLVVGECRFLIPEPHPWFWYRPNSRNQPRYPNLHAKNMAEMILVVNRGKGRLVSTPVPSVFVHDAEYGRDRVHANQKPIPLYRDLISRFTFTGDSVLDCFFGSGNSLAAAASSSRIPYGCDSNPEMLAFAIGSVKRLQQPVTKELIKASKERFEKNLKNEPITEDTQEEVQGESVSEGAAPVVNRPAGLSWEYEIFRIGTEYLGYLRYAEHNMGQRRSLVREELEEQLTKACEALDTMSALGIIDPCCCTPEEAMMALSVFEEAQAEEVEA